MTDKSIDSNSLSQISSEVLESNHLKESVR